jgi:type III pantothenate kinase
MTLAVDIGNTNIVIGGFVQNEFQFIERISTNRQATTLEFSVSIRTILQLHDVDASAIDGAILSSVVPSLTTVLSHAVQKTVQVTPLVVSPGIKTGLSICVDHPEQVGSDRVVDAVAAAAAYPLPVLVIDMGTATTCSVIDAQHRFLGGIIMAGMQTSLDALVTRTSQLPKISFDPPKQMIGTNTIDCIKSGLLYGTASCLDGIITRTEEALGTPVTTVITGGLAHLVLPYCKQTLHYDPDLLLNGLILLYQANRKQSPPTK